MLLREAGNAIKLKLDPGQPADIELLRIQVKPDATPVRAKKRRYPQLKREFMSKSIHELLSLGFVKTVSSSEWVSVPLIVPKRSPALYRLSVDYCPVNAVTRPAY